MIEVTDLHLDYPAGDGVLRVVDIPNWSVEAGEQIAIFGPSGSGKSTLLHLLSGVLAPTSGRVSVCGEEISTLSESQRDLFRARHIGYVFQNFNLLQGYSALENVLMGFAFRSGHAEPKLARSLLDQVGVGARMRHRPSEMSRGEQQRVAIARSLVKCPDVVLADEPTGSLDPRNKAQVVSLLRSMCADRGSTLVLVTHDQDVIARFEKQIPFADLNRACGVEVTA